MIQNTNISQTPNYSGKARFWCIQIKYVRHDWSKQNKTSSLTKFKCLAKWMKLNKKELYAASK